MNAFPPFRLDVVNQCLWNAQTRLPLMPKPFAVLRYLVEHAGRLVTQDELLGAIWPETYVQPEVLRKYILEIRRALGDRAGQPRFIATFPKRGYEFIAPVTDEAPGRTGVVRRLASPHMPMGRLVGRTHALAEMRAYLTATLSGERQVVFVTGEPGIGKTSVVDAFVRSFEGDRAIRAVRGHSVEGFAGKESYYPILAALAQLVRGREGKSSIEVLAAHAPTWLMQFPALVQARQREGLRQDAVGATRERMLRELCEALEIITEETALVLILEDLHWADHSTIDWLSAVARRPGPAKLLVIGTYRPVDVILTESPLKTVKQDLLVHRLCREVALDRLDEIDVAAYLADIAGVERAGGAQADAQNGHAGPDDQVESLAALIHGRSDGIPLFMAAMLDHLIQKNVVAPGDHGWTMRQPWAQVDPVPETLKQMLQVQIDDLSDPDRELLLCASVAGQRFTSWSAAILLETDAADAERRCGALSERQQVLRWVGARDLPDGGVAAEYEFKHALYREVLYRRLQPNRRASLHLRLATEMEALPTIADADVAASELASHFEEGREFGRAIPYLIAAATRATRRYAQADAAALLEHARQLLPKLAADRRIEAESQVLQRLGDTYYALGDVVRSASSYQAAATCAAEAGRPAVEMEALLRQAHPTALLDPDRAIGVCTRAAGIAREHGEVVAEARARLLAAGWRILLDGWRREDSETCAIAMKTLCGRGAGDVTPHEHVLYANVQFLQGQYTGACDHAEAALGNLTATDGLWEHLAGLTAKAVGLLHLGRFGEAHRTLTVGLELARKNGNAIWDGIVTSVLASLYVQAFDFEGVRSLSKELLEAVANQALQPVRLQMAPTRGYAELMLGDPARAVRYFEEVLDRGVGRTFMLWYWRMLARLGLAEVCLASGDLREAGEHADLVMDDASRLGNSVVHGLACEAGARIALARGTLERAEELVRQASEIADTPVVAWRVHATAWELCRRLKRAAEAERHRVSAEALLLQLAQSFEARDPLRQSLLAAGPVQKILRPPASVTDTGSSRDVLTFEHERLPTGSGSRPRKRRRASQN